MTSTKPKPNCAILPRVIHLGSIYCKQTHGGVGGDIFHPDGICRTIATAVGGRAKPMF